MARSRLPLDTLARLRCVVAAQTGQAGQLWKDFRVTVIAGTGISLPDTPENQRAYPQSREQKRGGGRLSCGFAT